MFNSNFFHKIFRYKKNISSQITSYDPSNTFKIQSKNKAQMQEIDREIKQNSQALLEAQIVKLRTTFSNPNNLFEQIGRNVYKNQIDVSINWHQKKLKDLYFERRIIQMELEKENGTFWINSIKRSLIILLLIIISLFSVFILISGILAMIYLLPFFILILMGYILLKKKY